MKNDFNSVFVSGKILGGPVIAEGAQGRTVLLQVVGTEQFYRGEELQERKEMHQVVVFPPLAQQAALYNEGDQVVVQGALRYKEVTKVHIIAHRLDKLA